MTCKKKAYDTLDLIDLNEIEVQRRQMARKAGWIWPNQYYCEECRGHHLGFSLEQRASFSDEVKEQYEENHGGGNKHPKREME